MNRWRTQFQVHRVVDDPMGLRVEGVLAGWNPHRVVGIPVTVLPRTMLTYIETSPGPDECTIYLHFRVNLDAEIGNDLRPGGPWELSKVHHHPVITVAAGTVTDFGVERLAELHWDENNAEVWT